MNLMKYQKLLATALLTIALEATADEYDFARVSLKIVNSSDDIGFNIASDLSGAATPNILSDLRWSDIDTWSLATDARVGLGEHFRMMTEIVAGIITDGAVTDSDYLGDNRTSEFSRNSASVDGRYRLFGTVSIGWEWRTEFSVPLWRVGEDKRMALASEIAFMPKLGYGYEQQEIEFSEGVQLIPPEGPFDGLNSDFDTEWQGIFGGFESEFRIAKGLYVTAHGRYWPDISWDSEAHWNLRTDLGQPLSFKQSAEGDGYDYEVGLRWDYSDAHSLGIAYYDADFETESGVHETITVDGNSLFTRLNNAEWQSSGWSLSFDWRF